VICLLPLVIGFIIPVLILIINSISYLDLESFNNLINLSINSFLISIITSLVIVILSLILVVGLKFYNFKGMNFLSTVAGIGYAFPGIIIALGSLFFISFLQNTTNSIFLFLGTEMEIIMIGSFFILIFAYVSRFNAVAFGAINSGISRIPPNMMEASLTLGKPFGFSFIKIILPLIKPSILTATILAFVDIIKELPITLLLRPFNFETLATYVYQYANDEMLGRASGPALLIVFIGLIPILFINNVMNKKTI
jgi:iron(III) transport system permease protein